MPCEQGSDLRLPGTWPASVFSASRNLESADLAAAYSAHPERFVRKPPQPLPAPKEVWINKPQPTPKNTTQ
jgi:putative transposase